MTATGLVKLSDIAKACRVNPIYATAVLRTLHWCDPGAWPLMVVCGSTVLGRETAVRLMTHLDTVHRPAFRTKNRRPQAERLARSLAVGE